MQSTQSTQSVTKTNKRFLPLWALGISLIFLLPALGCSLGSGSAGGALSPTATPNLIVYQDKLDGSTKSDWIDDSNCSFGSDGYHIKTGYICYSPADTVGDGVTTVSVKQITGPVTHAYGLVFRRPSSGNYYAFEIDSNGKWLFDKIVGGKTTTIDDFTENAAILKGLNQENTLSVTAQGSHFVFSVNGTQVGTADDTTFTTGETGLLGNDGIEVVFTNLIISKLKP
jgi:hypothetical protein